MHSMVCQVSFVAWYILHSNYHNSTYCYNKMFILFTNHSICDIIIRINEISRQQTTRYLNNRIQQSSCSLNKIKEEENGNRE